MRKLLVTVSLGLIAFPEPVTTAVGIVLLCATVSLFNNKPLNRFGNMEVLVKRSMRMDGTTIGSYGVPENASRIHSSWFDNRQVPEKVLHHLLKTSLPQYEVTESTPSNNNATTGMKSLELDVKIHRLQTILPQNTISGDLPHTCNRSITQVKSDEIVLHRLKTTDNFTVRAPVRNSTLNRSSKTINK